MKINANMSELKQQFEQDGCVILPNFLNQDELELVEQRLEAYLERNNVTRGLVDRAKFQGILKNMQKNDEFFAEMLTRGRPADVVKQLLDDELDPATAAYFDRIPGEETGITPHFDAIGHRTNGATLWIAIDEARIANGCLYYVKGSHKQELESNIDLPNFSPDTEGAFPVELKPGDAAVHSSCTVHWSSRNQTQDSRRGVSFFYWAASAKGKAYEKWIHKGKMAH